MKVIPGHRTVFFDVDDTLLIANYGLLDYKPEDVVFCQCPDTGYKNNFLKHTRHINLLRQFRARGHTIVVWSQGGYRWAESAVKALGLVDLVDVCIDKPSWYVDDLPCQAFMGKNVYLHPTDPSKDVKHYVLSNSEDEKREGEDYHE